ncbi:MAG: enolase C-terminal domain-like protein [Myxococcota bacterium]
MKHGITSLKIKIGANSLDNDIERVASIRRSVADTVRLRLDVNGAWTFDAAILPCGGLRISTSNGSSNPRCRRPRWHATFAATHGNSPGAR